VTIIFDFVAHQLVLQCSDGGIEAIPLEPRTVADFYRLVMDAIGRLGVDVHIWTMPVEVPNPIRFDADTTHFSRGGSRCSSGGFVAAILLEGEIV
jgi:uncharacterized protein DUF5996